MEVRLAHGSEEERVVGWLAETGPRIYFEYDPAFLREPLWLSPFKLPPEPGLREHSDRDFGPIFGLFDDSLPDGWGLLLMDRFFLQKGLAPASVSVLDRLAYLGTRTMGALTYHPPAGFLMDKPQVLDLHQLARASEEVIAGTAKDVLPQLFKVGGSPGGARPKVLVGVCGEELLSGEEDLPEGYTHWLVKFGGRGDPTDVGPIEFAYSEMAADAGITMPPTRLFETSQHERFFGVERFDRKGAERYHVHTFGNLIHADFRLPSCDYQQLLEVTRILTRNHEDLLQCYRRMVFNVLTHNRDDHVKNFAFRMTPQGKWELAPAYDIVFAQGPGGEHSTTIAGEGRAPARSHLLHLADLVGLTIKDADLIFHKVAAAAERWSFHAKQAGVKKETVGTVRRAIGECLSRL
jgi:serine/threonine-protein kinase HipA